LEHFAKAHGLDIKTFTQKYNNGEIKEPGLDEYFVHDRAGILNLN
jgi:alpha,alpha-trehalase